MPKNHKYLIYKYLQILDLFHSVPFYPVMEQNFDFNRIAAASFQLVV